MKTMNRLYAFAFGGLLTAFNTMAADFAIGTVSPVVPYQFSPGNGINLYTITGKGLDLVRGSPFILREIDFSGQLSTPLLTTLSPDHGTAYVAFTTASSPKILAFKLSPKGLIKLWESVLSTGSVFPNGSSIRAAPGFLIENTFPTGPLWVRVIDPSGKQIVSDFSNSGILVSGQVDPDGNFYYSCRLQMSTNGRWGGEGAAGPYKYTGDPADTVMVLDVRSPA
jgi:hypothetical protein